MRLFSSVILFFCIYQAHAGDLIFLDNYYLEKVEREASSDKVRVIEQMNDARGPVTQIEVNHRNTNDFVIRRNKNRRVHDNKDDSPLLQYHF